MKLLLNRDISFHFWNASSNRSLSAERAGTATTTGKEECLLSPGRQIPSPIPKMRRARKMPTTIQTTAGADYIEDVIVMGGVLSKNRARSGGCPDNRRRGGTEQSVR